MQQERATRTRSRLLDAAAVEFTESGFDGASVARISRSAHATTGAFYHHFHSKRIAAELVIEQQHARIEAAAEHVRTVVTSPVERVLSFVADLAQLIATDASVRATLRLVADPSFAGAGDVWEQWATRAADLARSQAGPTSAAASDAADATDEADVEAFSRAAITVLAGSWHIGRSRHGDFEQLLRLGLTGLVTGLIHVAERESTRRFIETSFSG
jgi:AcrR family transcriptional regulator